MSDLPRIDVNPIYSTPRGLRWLLWYCLYLLADRDHAVAVRSADVRTRPRMTRG